MPSKRSIKPRKKPKQERSQITVEAILEATARILVEKGYDKTNTNHIAEQAGVSIGSLYQYFPNKESLIVALMEQHFHEILSLVESHLNNVSDTPLEIVIPKLIKAVIAAHAINPRLHQVLNEEIPRSERLQNTDEKITELLKTYLQKWSDKIRPQNIDMTVFILSRTIETLCHSAVIEHPEFIHESQFEKEVSDLLLSYLLKKPC